MKKAIILASALLALPALAQDQRASLVFDQIKHEDTTFTAGTSANLSLDKTTAVGLRYGIAAAHFWNGALEVEGTIRPRSGEKDLKLNGQSTSTGTQSLRLSDEYVALGVGMRWTQVVDFGFMLEDRQEFMDFRVKDSSNGFDYTQRSGVNRPWLRANVGYTFQLQAPVKPFVNLSYGVALAKKGTDTNQLMALSASSFSQNFVIDFYSRSVLPKSDLQFEAGIRF